MREQEKMELVGVALSYANNYLSYIKFPPIIRSFIVTGILEKRVSASIAKQNIEEITQESELLKISLAKNNYTQREVGAGRPTKKDRRKIDKFKKDEL